MKRFLLERNEVCKTEGPKHLLIVDNTRNILQGGSKLPYSITDGYIAVELPIHQK